MRKFLTIVFVISMPLGIFAQTDYEIAVKNALVEFDSSKTTDDMKAVSAKFERIAAAETGQWLPNYYVAYVNCLMAFQKQNPSEIKLHTDYAQKFIDEALKIAPQESEVQTLQGMIYQAIIVIDPMNNGMTYGSKATGCFETAKVLNPENPRPYYLQAISVMYTPEEYGGGKKVAYGLFAKANDLFASFKPVNDLYPDWGKADCANYLIACSEK